MASQQTVSPKSRVSELSVYNGTICIGHIREELGQRTATTWPDEHALGVFSTRKAAADAISKAHQDSCSAREDCINSAHDCAMQAVLDGKQPLPSAATSRFGRVR